MLRKCRVTLAALACLAISAAAAGQEHQVDWEPSRYEIACIAEPSQCLGPRGHELIESGIEAATQELKKTRWRSPRLAPLTENGKAVQIFDRGEANRFAYHTPNYANAQSQITVGQRVKPWVSREHVVFWLTAHELFHAIQFRYPPFRDQGHKKAGWVQESTADAVILNLTRKIYPQEFPADTERFARRFSGRRRYDQELNTYFADWDGNLMGSDAFPYYETNSFWRHLAEVHHGGEYDFLHDYFLVRPEGDDWLGWLHRRLLVDPRIRAALAPVYALFVADYANWGDAGWPGEFYGRAQWLETTFGGCERITLSPEQAAGSVVLRLRRTAARCVQVDVQGLRPENRASVQVGAFAPDGRFEQVDQIQLSLASSTDWREFHCASGLRGERSVRLEHLDKCVFEPVVGDLVGTQPGLSARFWDVFTQSAGPRASGFENLYLVSRVAPEPTDTPSDLHDGGESIPITMRFVLDVSDLQMTGVQGDGDRRVIGHLNQDTAVLAQERVPVSDARGAPTLAVRGGERLRPPTLAMSESSWGGLHLLNLSMAKVRDTGLYEQQLSDIETLAFRPGEGEEGLDLRPLLPGDRGRYLATVVATLDDRSFWTLEPGTIEVHELSPWVLRASMSATICDVEEYTRQDMCPNGRQVRGRIVKPFPILHLPGGRLQARDTPGTEQYRGLMSRWRAIAGSPAGGSDATGGTPGDGTDGGVATACLCSCDELARYSELHAAATGPPEAASGYDQSDVADYWRLRACVSSCRPQWEACSGSVPE